MSAIFGVVDFLGPPSVPLFSAMRDTLRHRGPDAHRQFISHRLALGQNDLVVDPSLKGQACPPFCNERRTLWAVCDGFLYDTDPVRRSLAEQGHTCRNSHCAEIVLRAYEAWGEHFLERIKGVFALAIWDSEADMLFLARDRVGRKPLYYARTPQGFLFASELQAILQAESLSRKVDVESFDYYFSLLYVPAPRTMFAGVSRLPPAHFMQVREQGLHTTRYWEVLFTPQAGDSESLERMDHLFRQAVLRQTGGASSAGSLLSGGLDSSAVSSVLSSEPFYVGAATADFGAYRDEPRAADDVARSLSIKLRTVPANSVTRECLTTLIRNSGEPYADAAVIPSAILAASVRPLSQVWLGGDGGDDIFGGHPRHLSFIRDLEVGMHAKLPSCRLLPPEEKQKLLRQTAGPELLTDVLKGHLHSSDSCDVNNLCKYEFEVRLPSQLLTKIDTSAVFGGIEYRSPFLDEDLLAFAFSLPVSAKLGVNDDLEQKRFFKAYLRFSRLVPEEIVRRPKRGFGIPITEWLRGPLRSLCDETLRSAEALYPAYLNQHHVIQNLDEFQAGGGMHGYYFWKIIAFELWLNLFFK